ncbi:MAG: hypothetical protein M3220_15045 [Chloroflexota bacterium]|nr:hypothetical protein [Chloroflexota bacterium]
MATYGKVKFETLQRLLRHPLAALASHWVFQGLLYMDTTERRFKIALDALLTLVGVKLMENRLPQALSVPVAFLSAHTLNFLLNGQLWGVLKHYGFVNQSYDTFDRYAQELEAGLKREPSMAYAAMYGSLSRTGWTPASDLDLRLVRRPGYRNAFRACFFVLRERARALFRRFPLDIYVFDNFSALKRMRNDEPPIVWLDRRVEGEK